MPAGQLVYAIGDVHGRLDLLDQLIDGIDGDAPARGSAEPTIVFLGDLIDRGPHSREVVARVRVLCDRRGARLIKGNHEELLVRAATGDLGAARAFVRVGGIPTLLSYGAAEAELADASREDLVSLIDYRVPRADIDFLDRGEDMIQLGDYAFVHAGVRPGRRLDKQEPADLRWIREPFLSSEADHGAVVVHGHTPTPEVQDLPNRIGIDTGAFQSGVLTAVGLAGDQRWFVQATGPAASMAPSADEDG